MELPFQRFFTLETKNMKQLNTLVALLVLGFSTIATAQTLSNGGHDQYTEVNSTYLHEVKAHLTLINSGSSDVTYETARIFNGSTGIADSNYFCWDLCYGVGTDSSQFGGVTIPAGGRNTDFYIGWYIKPNSTTQQDSVIYRFYNAADPDDKLDVVFYLNVSPTISVVEVKELKTNVYPNPASDHIYVELDNIQSGSIRMMNLAGVSVLKKEFNDPSGRIRLEVGSLPAGVYMLQTNSEGKVLDTQRVVISH